MERLRERVRARGEHRRRAAKTRVPQELSSRFEGVFETTSAARGGFASKVGVAVPKHFA